MVGCFICNITFPASKLTEHVLGQKHVDTFWKGVHQYRVRPCPDPQGPAFYARQLTWCPVCDVYVAATDGGWEAHERLSSHHDFFLNRRVTPDPDPTREDAHIRIRIRRPKVGFFCKVCAMFLSDRKMTFQKIRSHAFCKSHFANSDIAYWQAREGRMLRGAPGEHDLDQCQAPATQNQDTWLCNACNVKFAVRWPG
eukprot:tig00000076_g2314.t1